MAGKAVLLVVEDFSVLAAADPLFQLIGSRFLQRVSKNAQRRFGGSSYRL